MSHPQSFDREARSLQRFLWWALAVISAIVLYVMLTGCTAPQQDTALEYAQALRAIAQTGAAVTPPGGMSETWQMIGVAAAAVASTLGALKLKGRNGNGHKSPPLPPSS
jgi:hypothetical protein